METSHLELEQAVSGDHDMDPLQAATTNLEHIAATAPSVTPEDLGRAGKPTAGQTQQTVHGPLTRLCLLYTSPSPRDS